MTYGWAILMVIIVFIILVYHGVFESDRAVYDVTTIDAPFFVNSQNVKSSLSSNGGVELELRNGGDGIYNVTNISIIGCGSAAGNTLIDKGGLANFTINCSSQNTLIGKNGKVFKGGVIIYYQKHSSSLIVSAQGSITKKISSYEVYPVDEEEIFEVRGFLVADVVE